MNLTQISSTFLLSTHPILDKAHRIKLLLVALLLFIRDGFCMSRSASRPSLQCEQWWDNCSSEPSRSWLNMRAIAMRSPIVNKQLRLSCNWWSLQHHLSTTIHDGLECDWALMRGTKIKNKMNLRWTHFHLMFASYSPACAEADKTRNGNRNQSLCCTSAAQYKQVHWKCFAPEGTTKGFVTYQKMHPNRTSNMKATKRKVWVTSTLEIPATSNT